MNLRRGLVTAQDRSRAGTMFAAAEAASLAAAGLEHLRAQRVAMPNESATARAKNRWRRQEWSMGGRGWQNSWTTTGSMQRRMTTLFVIAQGQRLDVQPQIAKGPAKQQLGPNELRKTCTDIWLQGGRHTVQQLRKKTHIGCISPSHYLAPHRSCSSVEDA